jgi:hypothetical protein
MITKPFVCSNIESQIKDDTVGFRELALSLHFHEIFHPTESFYMFKLRNAVMMQNLKLLLSSLAAGSTPAFTPPVKSNARLEGSGLDEKVIVLVIGKAHYYGLHEMWTKHQLGDKVFPNTTPSKPGIILSDDSNVVEAIGTPDDKPVELKPAAPLQPSKPKPAPTLFIYPE